MAGAEILLRQQAVALQEAIQTTETLLEGVESQPSERLTSAQHDVAGRTMPDYVFSMLIAELTRVVADQHEQVADLQKRMAELETSLFAKAEGAELEKE